MEKIAYLNPYNDGTGYAQAGIRTMLALDSVGYDVYPVETKLAGQNVPAPQRLLDLSLRKIKNPDIIIQHTLPPFFVYHGGAKNIGFFHIETENIRASNWQKYANLMDEIWVSCHQNMYALEDSGVTKPIKVVHLGADLSEYNKTYTDINLPKQNACTFYTISDWSTRKNVESVIRAYYLAFNRRHDVRLILKCYIDGKSQVDSEKIIKNRIDEIKKEMRLNNYPSIYLITSYLSDEGIKKLHATGDCCVFGERGAAWNLVAFDAMCFGNGVIVNRYGGQEEFCYHNSDEAMWQTSYRMSPVYGMDHCPYKNLYTGRELWGDPDIEEMSTNMSEFYQIWTNKEFSKDKFKQLRQNHISKFSLESIGNYIKNEVLS